MWIVDKRQQGELGRGVMLLRNLLALLLLGSLIVPTLLADASPPDDVWVSGIYDDGDYDDVVALIVSATVLQPPTAPASVQVLPVVATLAPHTGEVRDTGTVPSPDSVRAPPSA